MLYRKAHQLKSLFIGSYSLTSFNKQRIIEYPELKGTRRSFRPTPGSAEDSPKIHTVYLGALLKCFWNSVRLGAVTICLGSLFQCPTTLKEKNVFLISSLDLPWHNFMPLIPELGSTDLHSASVGILAAFLGERIPTDCHQAINII
ncbi:hypothetical protein WISP_120305 [Willisornis vidua]|uniref:Uncharacterized protein n=1 Tax=Willisornis vidua TaxID=1566151 RepID=A0ABQ9CT12_9PASS|nr:hypothetical protein WISP_120305 [Willisornis vidua]